MRTQIRQVTGVVLAAVITVTGAGAHAQQGAADEARLKKLDAGPATVDVSRYSADQQKAYKMFQAKCSTCHVIARAVNTEMVIPADWERYIKRMMYKPNSGISSAEGRTLFQFLVYDASVRKSALVQKALAALPGPDRTAAIARIKEINPAFVAP